MKKIRNKYGFSMAELLMVVAILVALFGVAFVAVQRHQRSMTQLEYDTIAKEIFVAAQNHLTAAESQGYLGQITEKSGYGTESGYINVGTSENDSRDKVFYLSKGTDGQGVMLDLMLPFGAIDETIRAGGSYIIRYQPSTARVLDVFYSNPGPVTAWLTLKGADLTDHYDALMPLRGEENKAARRNCDAIGGAVVGWYGNGDALPVGARLKAPQILIHNEETLWVGVKDTNGTDTSLVLIITGETSKAKKAFDLRKTDTRVSTGAEGYKIILDDITVEGRHFAELENTSGEFIPGENITIEAIAYNNEALTNIAYSGKGRTNSIFADPSSYEVEPSTDLTTAELNKVNGTVVYVDKKDSTKDPTGIAAVANFRHLENLDRRVSNWVRDTGAIKYSSAIQLTNLSDGTDGNDGTGESTEKLSLSWESFVEKTGGVIWTAGNTRYKTNDEQYLPVNLENSFNYDGCNHIIAKVSTDGQLSDTNSDAGIFGTLQGGTVSNLLVLDSTISSSESSGGLIGSMSGTEVIQCAAYGTVTSSSAAGGLIGSASSGSVTSCYSAGHTEEGSYEKWIEANTYDVTGATAGGLIGSALGTTLKDSYSTCSVSGTGTVGGFVGKAEEYAEGDSITNCYAVGLVTIPKNDQNQSVNGKIGAFAGEMPETLTPSNCCYYSVINEVKRTEKRGYESVEVFDHYLGPVGDAEKDGVTEIDLNAQSYEEFVGAPDTWTKAEPHDDALKTYYNVKNENKYNLKGISRLDGSSESQTDGTTETPDPIVYTHYGDWPAPEIFVINAKNQ